MDTLCYVIDGTELSDWDRRELTHARVRTIIYRPTIYQL